MAWSTPRTWTDTEIVTAAMMNAHLSGNLAVIKVPRDDVGRLRALDSSTLADLSAANLSGLARPGEANTFTAGRTRFLGDSVLVYPVGADKYEDLGGGLRRGDWIEGQRIHHIGQDQATEWAWLGTYVDTPPTAVPGEVRIVGSELHYIDASGDRRKCVSAGATGAHTDAPAIGGSSWTETYSHWIRESGGVEIIGHADIAHSDGTVHNDAHSDVSHADSHTDTGHSDSHGDHSDIHYDQHSDQTHQDYHADHTDGGHADVPHGDVEHSDYHIDQHYDCTPACVELFGHTDTHTDVPYANSHLDSHTDTHSDHDDHGDHEHQDQPEVVT